MIIEPQTNGYIGRFGNQKSIIWASTRLEVIRILLQGKVWLGEMSK